MHRVSISVEGHTEERFVKEILSDYFEQFDIYLKPILVTTKKVKSGPNFKGGLNSYEKVKNEIRRLLRDSGISVLTTMYDLYGLPADFPGFSNRKSFSDCQKKVKFYEKQFKKNIDNAKFLPFFMLHEFETLLFVSPTITANKLLAPDQSPELETIVAKFNSVEQINDGPETHPSKRIQKLFPKFKKVRDGTLITKEIGLNMLMEQCPHFKQWIETIKARCK